MTQDLQVRVARRTIEAEGICAFDLVPVEGHSLPAFTPGAHIDVKTPSGAVRQYSLCNDAADSTLYRIAVLREQQGRGGSRAMHEQVQEGDILTISEPRNHFPLTSAQVPSLLLAGGIGITPLLAMAHQLVKTDSNFSLHYCTRSEERTGFRDILDAPVFAGRTWIHRDDEPAPQRFDVRRALSEAAPSTHLYVCGPGGFIQMVLETAADLGWSDDRVHREFFSAAPVKSATEHDFEVVISSSGQVIPVLADVSVAAALNAAGVSVETSCEQGVCGTCITRILDGIPDHRDFFLTPDEQAAGDQFTPCCSRALSGRLVLDL